MRAIPEVLDAGLFGGATLVGSYTEPAYLVETTLDELLRLSTRGDITYDSSVWKGGVVDLAASQDWADVRLRLANGDGRRTQFMVGGAWRDSRCRVWQVRPDAPIWYGFAATAESWTASNGTAVQSNGALVLTKTGGSGNLHGVSPGSLTIDGSKYRYVVIRLRGSVSTTPVVFYTTSGHGFDTNYRKVSPTAIVGSDRTLIFDMWSLTAGGTDWATNTITQFRISFMSVADAAAFNVEWAAVATDVRGEGVAPIPAIRHGFISNIDGWTATGGSVAWSDGALVATKSGSGNLHILSPAISVKGSQYKHLLLRIRGSSATPSIFYTTGTHSFDNGYRKAGAVAVDGLYQTLVFDMSALTAGGTDWVDNIITQIRITFGSLSGGEQFVIDWLWLSAPIDTHKLVGTEVATLLLFDGRLSSASRVYPQIELNATRGIGSGRNMPPLRVAPPNFNHLPAVNSVIEWNSDKYLVARG